MMNQGKQKTYSLEDEERLDELKGLGSMNENMEEMGDLLSHFPGPKATKTKMEDFLDAIVEDPEDTRALLTLMSLVIDESAVEGEEATKKKGKAATPMYQKHLGKIDKVLKQQLKAD
jgi:DNA-binding transcriptional MerR regulator